ASDAFCPARLAASSARDAYRSADTSELPALSSDVFADSADRAASDAFVVAVNAASLAICCDNAAASASVGW
ncbi:hypothetical protein ACN22T_005051, partial [Escherichia coli]